MNEVISKRIIVLLICFVLSMMALACEKSNVGQHQPEKPSEMMDLETFLQAVDLPENFSIGFDVSEVESVDFARVYKAVSLELDAGEVAKKLLKRPIIATEVYAQGPWFETGDEAFKEYLTVYDGGKSLGMDSGVVGGLSYSVLIGGKSISEKQAIFMGHDLSPSDNLWDRFKYTLKNDYASFADLSFMDHMDALAEVEKVLYDTLEFPELEIAEAYSMDYETMQKHYQLYTEAMSRYGIQPEKITFSKDDECYAFFFRQVLDGIPVINVIWQGGMTINSAAGGSDSAIKIAAGNSMPYTNVSVYYDKNGVRSIRANDLYEVVESGEKKPLIGGAEALQVVIDHYSEILLASETIVQSMELCYVGVPSGDHYQLIPAWVFCIMQAEERMNQTDGAGYPIYSYDYYVVDAITGEKISS